MAHGIHASATLARIAKQRDALKKRHDATALAMAQQRVSLERAMEVVQNAKLAEAALEYRHAHDAAVVEASTGQLHEFFDDPNLDAEAAEVVAMAQEQARFTDVRAPLDSIPEAADEESFEFNEADFAADELNAVADAGDPGVGVSASDVNLAGFYEVWSEAYPDATAEEKFAAFKDMVLRDDAPVPSFGSGARKQHEENLDKLEAAIAQVQPSDQAALQNQLNQYHLDEVAKNPSIDPVLAMDMLINQCDAVDTALMAELQGDMAEAGGADNFIKEQERAMAFYNNKMKGNDPTAAVEASAFSPI